MSTCYSTRLMDLEYKAKMTNAGNLTDAEKVAAVLKYLGELQERIDIRYQGSHEDKRVGYGYEVVKSDLEQVLKGTYEFTEDF